MQSANRIPQKIANDTENTRTTSGLLSRVRSSSGYDTILSSFRKYLSSINAERGALLCPSQDGFSVLILSTGFDFTTVRRFCPKTISFNELFSEKQTWNHYSGIELDHFNAFFSSHERASLKSLFIRPVHCVSESTWYVILVDSLLNIHRDTIHIDTAESLLPALMHVLGQNSLTISALSYISTINQSCNSMKAHVQSAIDAKRIATLTRFTFSKLFEDDLSLQIDTDSQSIYFGIVNRIARQAGSSNILYIRPNFDLHIVLFTSLPVDTELYFHQIMKPLHKIFGFQRISRIQTETIGTSSSVSAIMDFLIGAI